MKILFASIVISLAHFSLPFADMTTGNKLYSDEKYADALAEYSRQAEAGDAESAYLAANMYRSGKSGKINFHEAIRLYNLALNGGLNKAGLGLGRIYSSERNIRIDMMRAVGYLEIAALDPAGGETAAEAAFFLAQIFRGNSPSVPVGEATAFKWLEVAAENDHPDAAAEVGLSYYSGGKVAKNPAKAFRFVRAAAVRDHAIAQFNMGLFYYQGIGTRADPIKALAWFMLAKNTDPATDNGTIDNFKAAMTASQNKAALVEYERIKIRQSQ